VWARVVCAFGMREYAGPATSVIASACVQDDKSTLLRILGTLHQEQDENAS
jgi:hypothetical protein